MPTELPRLSDEAILETASGLVSNRIFTASQLPEGESLSVHFLPLIAGWGDIDPATVGNVIADMADAAGMAVNGYPCFFKCRVIHRDDWERIATKALKVQEAFERALREED